MMAKNKTHISDISLAICNMTMFLYPKRSDLMKDELIHEIFVCTATPYPDKVVIIWQDEQMTYRQLHEHSFTMVRLLRSTNQIGPGSIVNIRLSRMPILHKNASLKYSRI